MGSYRIDGNIDINNLKQNLKQLDNVTNVDSITVLPTKVTVDGYEINIDTNGKVIVGNINEIQPGEKVTGTENKTYIKNGTAIIPVGFAIVPGLDDIEQGLVISDDENDTEEDSRNIVSNGNQFVWIPVTDENKYIRNESYENKDISKNAYTDKDYLPNTIQPDVSEALATDEKTLDEAIGEINENAERRQVCSKRGFYISRYEAGKETVNEVDKLVSKKGANIWVKILQKNTTEENCKTISKTFINNENVQSALISGIQWDMTMAFITRNPLRKDGNGNDDYNVTVKNSTRHVGGNGVAIAGNNKADKVCNIYDLEGNAREYVAEKNTYDTYSPFVHRGGHYDVGYSASNRSYDTGSAYINTSFRFVLYIK